VVVWVDQVWLIRLQKMIEADFAAGQDLRLVEGGTQQFGEAMGLGK